MKLKIVWAAIQTIAPFITLGALIMMLLFGDLDSATKNYYSALLAGLAVLMAPYLYFSRLSLATIMKVYLKQ